MKDFHCVSANAIAFELLRPVVVAVCVGTASKLAVKEQE
jgi:hypothetical protein